MRPFPGGIFPVRSRRFAAAGVAVVLALLGSPARSAAPNELGHPVIREFPPGKSRINHLCQAVTQDADGFIYLANGIVTRCYDGTTWKEIAMPDESAGIRKFATAADGTIYAGGAGVIGFFRTAGVDREFVSLADRLPPSATGCDDLFDVLAAGDSVYFADEEKILVWRHGTFAVIPCATPPHSRGARLHRVGEEVYVSAPDRALSRIVGDRLEVAVDDPVVRQNQLITVEPGAAGALTVLTASRGFFQLDAGGRFAPWPTESNRWLAGKSIWRAQRAADGSLAVAFTSVSGDGGMRFGPDGSYGGALDSSTGLYVKTIRDLLFDREGGLWLATETGLIRLEWPSALTIFDGFNGLGLGAVADVVRHEGVLYAATSEGVFRLVPSDDTGRCASFERVYGHPAYALVSHPGGLLALGYSDVLVQTASGFVPVAKLPPGGGSLRRSKREPARVWIATTQGVRSVRQVSGAWHAEGPAATGGDGAPTPAELAADGGGFDALGARWVAGPGGIFRERRNGAPPQALPQLANHSAGAVARLLEEARPEGPVLWICGATVLVRVEVARAFPAPRPFATLLRSAQVRPGARLAPDLGAFTFDYVALRHQIADSVTYQSRLVGRDEWSAWTPQRERTFAGLPAGDYRFEVRARDADGHFAVPAALAFAVLPPWWWTWWALLGYAVAVAGLVAGVVAFRTRALRRQADGLEAIIAERTRQLADHTRELAHKNAELVRLHQLELDEKISARLAEEKARLEVLRYQLNPHFLFNTLASISAALPAGRSTPRTMVERLGEFCRLTLHRSGDRDWTTLAEEVQLLRSYLEIERSRWGDLLDIEIACDPALDDQRLPHFLLLPLVENALKYGRATSLERVGVRLATSRGSDGALVLSVANTGEWIEPGAKKTVSTLGIGLDNLRERLARHYPGAHQLEFLHAAGWVTVVLRIFPPPVS